MGKPAQNQRDNRKSMPTVAVACQGGGMHAAFEVGVLVEILKDAEQGRTRSRGIERDISRSTERARRLVWSRSQKRKSWLEDGGGVRACGFLGRLHCEHEYVSPDQFFDLRCIQSPGNGDPWHQSVRIELKSVRSTLKVSHGLPAGRGRAPSNTLIWIICSIRRAHISTASIGSA